MRLTWKIRRKVLRLVAGAVLLSLASFLYWFVTTGSTSTTTSIVRPGTRGGIMGKNSFMSQEDLLELPPQPLPSGAPLRTVTRDCTMSTCFDLTKCMKSFKVYVYPSEEERKGKRGGSKGGKLSPIYKKIIKVLRESSYYTEDPDSACLLVLSLDTLDRDPLSTDYIRRLPEKLGALRTWNNGRNHLIFNMYSGSFPEYSDQLDFDHGEAIVAKASFALKHYRSGFDISLPLTHKLHSEKGRYPGGMATRGNLFPIRRRYLLVFKGKRYLWGLGSETRNALYHLDNGDDVIMLTTCKHGKFWDRYSDERCRKENLAYEM